jgi:hypothetical protein
MGHVFVLNGEVIGIEWNGMEAGIRGLVMVIGVFEAMRKLLGD